ncbi:recombinase family protein [Bradyrhizobium sp. 164]|uniref:recombinase family protein n=1 Tax=Bradyrhizobium sp. 164 TaxID=2782637 RepID=UPI001FF7BC3A|nr:recombinase family protein [Bradyrhizobium sp. 164]
MNEQSKITAEHLRRCAIVYVRQSSTTQVEHNRESTARQYELAERAGRLGWRRDQVKVIDEDLGVSGSGLSERIGFAPMTAEVGLGQVGIVLGLEVSRLARNNADWYRLLDLCGLTHTLIGDGDGIYHPGLFNDRLVLGLKGTMSEAELHVLRARLLGGIRNKAARGELHRGSPVGLVQGDADGEVLLHPDESVQAAIHAVFDRFAEFGTTRVAVVPLARPALSAALQQPCRSPLGRPNLHKDPPGPHQPVLCRRLCVWLHPADMLSRCGRSNPKAHQTTRPRAVAGVHA